MTATIGTSSAALETSCRRLLRVLPRGYRTQREREMVDVMIGLSGPNRRRPTIADALDVAAIAARQWFRVLFLPRRGEGRTAAAALAVILPLLLAYPVGRAASRLVFPASATVRGIGLPDSPYQHPAWPVWLCWALAIGCVLLGRAGLARFPAAAGTLGFALLFPDKVTANFQEWAVMDIGWLMIQVVALVLLARPATVKRGLLLAPRRALVVITLAAAGLGALDSWYLPIEGLSTDVWPARPLFAAILAAAALACLASTTGRAALPFLTALLVPIVAARTLFSSLRNVGGSPTFQHLPVDKAALAVLALVAVYAGCRLLASAAESLPVPARSTAGSPLET